MPVIKSIGRKDTNFKQLISYLHKDDGGQEESFTYLHNLTGVAPDDLDKIEEAFKNNNEFRQKRKKGVGQYHEVISFHPEDTSVLLKHPEIVEDITRIYLELRAPDTLAIARPHLDKGHLHIHFMISPNELGKKKAIRLSKKEFHAVQKVIEKYQREAYPELRKSIVEFGNPDKGQNLKVRSHKEWQMDKRGVRVKDKQEVKSSVQAFLSNVDDQLSFEKALLENDMETYRYKGKLQGVVYNGRKYRFSRLISQDSELMQKVEEWREYDLER